MGCKGIGSELSDGLQTVIESQDRAGIERTTWRRLRKQPRSYRAGTSKDHPIIGAISMRTIIYQLELAEDRTVIITLPEDVPLGKHQLIVIISDQVKETSVTPDTYDELLVHTSGLWKQGDGLRYQEKIRAEWNRES